MLSAKEWLEVNEITNVEYDDSEILMERYANYKTKYLQALILEFRRKLPLYSCLATKPYDEHFNLITV